jgi:serine/threonine protein kinase
MFDAGRGEAEGEELIYCVCEYPDDFLAGVLAERPLTPGETREVLDAALSTLGYLHERGLVHGAVESHHIMAFGETIKLPSDRVRLAGEEISPASDMRALGVLLHEMLTREVPREDAQTDYSYIPEPFRSIVRNTLKPEHERWTVSDVRAHLNPPPKVEPPPVAVPVAVAEKAVEEVAVEAPPPEEVKAPERPAVVTLPPPRPRQEPLVDRGFPLKWVPVAGVAAAAVLGAFVLRNPGVEPAPAPAPAPVERPVATKPSTPAPAPVNPPEVTPQPPKPSPLAAPNSRADRAGTPDARPSTGAPIWRVIAYTYNGKTLAEKKVRSLNEKRPAWRAELFTPKGERGPYLVSLGGRMTLAEAERVQRDARAKGLPRDTFVRNFSN